MNINSVVVAASVAAVAIILVFAVEGADAKRGCATFGHSCYGAMGKRRTDINDEIFQDVQQENPETIFTGPRSDLLPEPERTLTPQQFLNISPLLRQWLQSYRKAQHGDNM